MRREKIDCPGCGFRLAGTRFSGYRCVKCHSHFSARFIAQTGRMHIKHLINKHFSVPNVIVEQTDVVIKDDGKLERMLNPKPSKPGRHEALEHEIARHQRAAPVEPSVPDDQYVELTAEIMSLGKPEKKIPSRVIAVPPRQKAAKPVEAVRKKTVAKVSLNSKRRR